MADTHFTVKCKNIKWVPLTLTCVECAESFVQTYAQQLLYCSRKCNSRAWKKRNPERHRAGIEKYALKLRSKPRPPKTDQQLLAAARKRLVRSVKKVMRLKAHQAQSELDAQRPCVKCGSQIGMHFTKGKKLCQQCVIISGIEKRKDYRQSAACKESRKADKKYRRAIERGAEAERFKPIEIFMRDGWRCQICGVSTPQSRRGTYHHNAPELDHIVPLSKGGKHTKTNVQCACRSCNADKSDRVVVGQMGLFAA